MKKATKILITAAAVAAVAGVAGVSYAAWAGGANQTATAGGQLGSISAYGFDSALTATMDKKLMPYDQPDIDTTTQAFVWSVALPTITATSATKLQVNYSTDKAPTLDTASGIYVKYSTTEVTAAPANTNGYQKVTGTAADLTGATFAANAQAQTTGYLVVILDSSKLADMEQNFEITVTVVEAA